MHKVLDVGNIRSRGIIYIVWFLTKCSGSFPVVPFPVGRVYVPVLLNPQVITWLALTNEMWLDMLKPLGRTFKREPLFYYFCSPSARWQRLLYWSASWNEDDIEQSYSWALTDKQPKWEIYFLIESHGDLEVPYHNITLPILTDTHILIILILTLESLCQFAQSSYV